MSTALASTPDARFDLLISRIDRLEQTVARVVGLLEQAHPARPWKHLERRPHRWRRQLYMKGRNMTARQLAGRVLANEWTPEAGARDYNLPVEAVQEALEYTRQEQALLEYEAMYELHLLQKRGHSIAPATIPR